jgi:hypothetical protein
MPEQKLKTITIKLFGAKLFGAKLFGALPTLQLFYLYLGRTMGIEPTYGGTTNHCLNLLATLAVLMNYNIT